MRGEPSGRLTRVRCFAGLLTIAKNLMSSGSGRGSYPLGFGRALKPSAHLSAERCAGPVAKQVNPAVDGTNSGDKLPHVQRLRHEVVGAEISTNHLIRFVQHAR